MKRKLTAVIAIALAIILVAGVFTFSKGRNSNSWNLAQFKAQKINESKKKKPDADGDGVPDWADKKPSKDDNAEDKEEVKESQQGLFAESLSLLKKYAGI